MERAPLREANKQTCNRRRDGVMGFISTVFKSIPRALDSSPGGTKVSDFISKRRSLGVGKRGGW
jgi:hypothetical protein